MTSDNVLKILPDDIEDNPINYFGDPLGNLIVDIVTTSDPNFSIGIFGEWGTGKTTLMNLVNKKLDEKNKTGKTNILTVWFDAWRYEREEQFALVPLMRTIAYKMDEQPKYEKAKVVFFKSIVTAAKGLASKYVLPEKYVEELHGNLTSSAMKTLAEEDKDTIYFHGLKQIEDEMKKVLEDSPESRVVVFIDDLDRCSPKKVLEVFESIKAFLGIKGFIYILGLSREIILKAVKEAYRQYEIDGEEYIKKIIQLPIRIPDWDEHIEELIGHLLKMEGAKKIGEKYWSIIEKNKSLIAKIVEPNPREVKRFINSYMLAYEKHPPQMVEKGDHDRQLLVAHALKMRWESFFNYFCNDEQFRKIVEQLASNRDYDRKRIFDSLKEEKKIGDKEYEEILSVFISKPNLRNLWRFLEKDEVKSIIFKMSIEDWKRHRIIVSSVEYQVTTQDITYRFLSNSTEKGLY
jgi:hypothetical protein